jgi:hypothetical protein
VEVASKRRTSNPLKFNILGRFWGQTPALYRKMGPEAATNSKHMNKRSEFFLGVQGLDQHGRRQAGEYQLTVKLRSSEVLSFRDGIRWECWERTAVNIARNISIWKEWPRLGNSDEAAGVPNNKTTIAGSRCTPLRAIARSELLIFIKARSTRCLAQPRAEGRRRVWEVNHRDNWDPAHVET